MNWFKQLGTIAFEPSTMRQHLFFGRIEVSVQTGCPERITDDPSALCLAEWLMFVPQVYRPGATHAVTAIAKDLLHEKATPEMIEHLISVFQRSVDKAVRDGDLTIDGWAV